MSAPTTRYVSPTGDDTNDGLSWDTAVKTILTAYDSLDEAGGTIYIAEGSWVAPDPGEDPPEEGFETVANQGIWIMGAADPQYDHPPAGWRRNKYRVQFIGVGTGTTPTLIQFARPGAASIKGGRPSDTDPSSWARDSDKPAIWISGCGEPISFKNLNFPLVQVGVRLGVASDNEDRNCQTALVDFENVNISLFVDETDLGAGPVVDAGYAFWITWRKCSLLAYAPAEVGSSRRPSILLQPAESGFSGGLWVVDDCRFANGGGIKFDLGSNASDFGANVSNCYLESIGTSDPLFWISTSGSAAGGVCVLTNLANEVVDGEAVPTVRTPVSVVPSVVTAIDCVTVEGPATLVGTSRPFDDKSMGAYRQIGVSRDGPRGNTIAGRGAGAIFTARFQPQFLAPSPSFATGYPPVSLGDVSVSPVAGPTGLTAYRLATEESIASLHIGVVYSGALAEGDLYIFGGWVRAPEGNSGVFVQIGFPTNAATFDMSSNHYVQASAASDHAWHWISFAAKIVAVSSSPSDLLLSVLCADGFPIDIFQPAVYRFPAGSYDENDILEWSQHVPAFPSGVTAGNAVLLPGQGLEFSLDGGGPGRQVGFGNGAPDIGNWAAGSIVYSGSPLYGRPKGWMAVVGGTPGTWAALDSIPFPVPSSGLKLWLRADLGVTSSSGAVSSWADLSGNGNDLGQVVSGSRPTLVSNVINGQPGISFPGSPASPGVFLSNGSTNLVASGAARTIVVVARSGSSGTILSAPFAFRRSTPLFGVGWTPYSGSNYVYSDGVTGTSNQTVPSAPATSTDYVLEFTFDGTTGHNVTFTENGSSLTVSNGGTGCTSDTGSTGFTVGAREDNAGASTFNGKICEILVYDHVVSGAELAAVRQYLETRYLIPLDAIPRSGLKLWLRADMGVTTVSGVVSNWADLSGNGNDVAQSSPESRPVLVSNAIGGRPGISFPGSPASPAVYLHNTTANPVSSGTARTLIIVAKAGRSGSIISAPFSFRRSSPFFGVTWTPYMGPVYVYSDGATTNLGVSPSPNYSAAYVLEYGADGNSSHNITFAVNGASQTVSSIAGSGCPSDTGTTGFTVGAREDDAGATTFNGEICEILVYDHVLSSPDLTSVRQYLQARYGIDLGV
jgi:hypothetical protein